MKSLVWISLLICKVVFAAAPTLTTPTPVAPQANGAASSIASEEVPLIPSDVKFLDKYPHLKDNLFVEPESNFYLGMSAGVFGVVESNMYFNINLLQVHYRTPTWDNEILSIAYGQTSAQSSEFQSNHFVFRTVPKWRYNEFLSFGPLFGYEFVSFPNVQAALFKNSKDTEFEPFSTHGFTYGLCVTEGWKLESGTKFRVSEVLYMENYSVSNAGRGWSYLFNDQSLRLDPSPVKGGTVVSIEVGFIY